MRDETRGNTFVRFYDSLAEFGDAVAKAEHDPKLPPRVTDDSPKRTEFCGGTFADAIRLAREGWHDQLGDALEVAESAVETADKEHMMDSFSDPVWDVTGAQVDVGAFLAGTPECMIDYPLSTTSKVGRVITLVASGTTSAVVSADTIIRRGRLVVALALALTRLGHAVEIWADFHYVGLAGGVAVETPVMVKGANDEVDPAAIMFALAHPAFFRRLAFAAGYTMPGKWGTAARKASLGMPGKPTRDLYPEGAIVLPEICSDRDVPEADVFLRKYLGELGLLAE